MITDRDVERQVLTTLGSEVTNYDVYAITAEIVRRYGTIDVGTIPADEYWEIVRKHRQWWWCACRRLMGPDTYRYEG